MDQAARLYEAASLASGSVERVGAATPYRDEGGGEADIRRRGIAYEPFRLPRCWWQVADRNQANLGFVCKKAGLVEMASTKNAEGRVIWRPTIRIHDLRHSFASILVSAGASLPLIGQMLGHTQPQTTARYAHLYDDPLRDAAEIVGAVVLPKLDENGGRQTPRNE